MEVFHSHPDVEIASNKFRGIPVILQYENTPMIEVVKVVDAGYDIQFMVNHQDGTPIAKVVGPQIYRTDEGKKANLIMRYLPNATVCELEGKPVFELRREGATALKGQAELYATDGVLVKANDSEVSALLRGSGDALIVGNKMMKNLIISGCHIGILVTRTKVSLGGGGPITLSHEGDGPPGTFGPA